jgi:hypothetical protein
MKALFLNAISVSGNKKADGKPFSFSQVNVLKPVENRDSDNYHSHGHGHEIDSFDLDPKALALFEGIGLGSEVELTLEPQPSNPRRNWVTSVK